MFTFHDFLNIRNAIDRTEFKQFLGSSKIKKPKWLIKLPKDNLHSIYDNFENFYKNGEVYLSCLMRANTSLFNQISGDRPAQMIYTNDSFYYEHPEELLKIVDNICKIKCENPSKMYEFQDLYDILDDDFCRVFNFKLPYEFTKSRDVFITSVMVFREHIPFQKISNFFYPLLVLKDVDIGAMIVPKWYWSENFRRYINFSYDNVVKPITYNNMPPNAKDFFEPFSSVAFFKEHPLHYVVFTILEIIALITPLGMYIRLCDTFNDKTVTDFNVTIGLLGTCLISFGFINVIWSFMDKYLGNKLTVELFISGIILTILSIILMMF